MQNPHLSFLSEQSLETLGLKKQPFPSAESIDEFYSTQSIEMLIRIIMQHLCDDNMTLLVKGEFGRGKSSFNRIIQQNAPENLIFTCISASANICSAKLLVQILPTEQQDPNPEIENTTKLTALHFFKQMSEGKQPVLVIDDAHLIPFKVLATLFKFLRAISNQGRGRAKLLLMGENEIDKNLDGIESRLLDKSSIFSTLLRPFSREQTEEYLLFQLKQAGFQGSALPLKNKQIDLIHKASGGVPGMINDQFCNWLESGDAKNDKSTIMEIALDKLSFSR